MALRRSDNWKPMLRKHSSHRWEGPGSGHGASASCWTFPVVALGIGSLSGPRRGGDAALGD